ncbi:hypothetical protein ACFQU7_31200 [Pseudoroseomonas wenyumeiae]
MFNAWSEIGATTASYGWSNGNGWSHSEGDYVQLALATLSGIAELTGSQAAADAYHALLADNPPFTSGNDFSRDPTFAIVAPGEDNAPVFQIPAPSVPSDTAPPVHTAPDAAPDSNHGSAPAAPALCSSRARCRCRSCWVARPGKATRWRWCWWMASRSSAAR